MRLVLHDFGGYPFTAQLARAIGTRGHEVHYLHAAGFKEPRADLRARPADPVTYAGIDPGGNYVAGAGIVRLLHERRYGDLLALRIRDLGPDAVISANTPLEAQSRALRSAHRAGAGFVFWMQDVHGLAVGRLLRRRFGPAGSLIGAWHANLERRLLRESDAVIAIADDFLPVLARWQVREERVTVIENWAPVDELLTTDRRNQWAVKQGFADRTVLLYSGTLGRKHDPTILVDLARGLPQVTVAIVAEGAGMQRLRSQRLPRNIRLLPLQPPQDLPDVLGAADILVAVLDEDASEFSVPSKVLSYLAAGRPILAAIPAANLAARVLSTSGAAVVVDPQNRAAIVTAAADLLSDPNLLARGRRGRMYAQRAFHIDDRADRVEEVLRRIARQGHVRGPGNGDTSRAQRQEADEG